jgi:hypothetical protein
VPDYTWSAHCPDFDGGNEVFGFEIEGTFFHPEDLEPDDEALIAAAFAAALEAGYGEDQIEDMEVR